MIDSILATTSGPTSFREFQSVRDSASIPVGLAMFYLLELGFQRFGSGVKIFSAFLNLSQQ
ncbi:hypothetical protein EBX31_01030 [bacterium]|nr:hypothetical protein [bacterium]